MKNLTLMSSVLLIIIGQSAFGQSFDGPNSSGTVIVCFTSDGEIKRGFDTIDGEVIDHGFSEIVEGTGIYAADTGPAQIGLSFGFFANFLNVTEPVSLTGVVRHPPMGLSGDGKIEQRWPIDLPEMNEVSTFVGYTLEDPFELVLGEWVFSIWNGETKMLEETITLVDPSESSFSCE